MPFRYDLPIPKLFSPQPDTVRIAKWLIEEHAEVHRGTEIAVLETPKGQYIVMANGDGFLMKRYVQAGAEVSSTEPIASIGADGENVPYGRPHSLAAPANRKG